MRSIQPEKLPNTLRISKSRPPRDPRQHLRSGPGAIATTYTFLGFKTPLVFRAPFYSATYPSHSTIEILDCYTRQLLRLKAASTFHPLHLTCRQICFHRCSWVVARSMEMTIEAIIAIIALVIGLPPTLLVMWKCVQRRRRERDRQGLSSGPARPSSVSSR